MPLNTFWKPSKDPRIQLYISQKDGDDAQTGLDPASPKKQTLPQNPNNLGFFVLRFRDGYYTTIGDINRGTNQALSLQGDGNVILDVSAFPALMNGVGRIVRLYDIHIKNAQRIVGNSVAYAIEGTNFIVENYTPGLNERGAQGYNVAVFINSTCRIGGTSSFDYGLFKDFYRKGSYFGGTYYIDAATFVQDYYDDNVTLITNDNVNITYQNSVFKDNGTAGTILNGSRLATQVTFSNNQDFSQTIANPNGSGGTITFINCRITDNPKFHDDNGNYNLRTDEQFGAGNGSPLIFESRKIAGAFPAAFLVDASNPAFTQTDSIIEPEWSIGIGQTFFTFTTTPNSEGRIRSTLDPANAITLPRESTISEVITLFADQNFSNPSGTKEVIDRENYDPNDPNPNVAYTWRWRVYDELEPFGANNTANWLPNSAGAGNPPLESDFYELRTNDNFGIDSSGKGSGNVDAVLSALGNPTGKRFQIEIVGRNNGV